MAPRRILELLAAGVCRQLQGMPVQGRTSNQTNTHSQQKSSVNMAAGPSLEAGRNQAINRAAARQRMEGTSGKLAYRAPKLSL